MTKPIIVVKVPCKLLYVIQVKELLIKCSTSWPYLISEFLVAYITIVASDWPRTFFTPKVFLFSICITDAAEIFEPSEERTKDIVEGRNTTLRCIGVGYPPPLVQWRKLNESLSDRVSITNMSMSANEGNVTRVTVDLIFTRASREDTGVYECLVSNLLKSVAICTILTIQCKQAINY